MSSETTKSQEVIDYFLNKEAEKLISGEKQKLYLELRSITDFYVLMLHQLKGYRSDSLLGFKAYLKEFEAQQTISSQNSGIPIQELDKAQLMYTAGGAPDDPRVVWYHECTQGELKARLGKGKLNENLLGYFCLSVMYQFWEDVRGKLATALKIKIEDIKSDIFGDMRHLRNDIIHHKGIATKKESVKNKLLKWFNEGDVILISEKNLDDITNKIFDFMNELISKHTGHKPYQDYSLSLIAKQRQMEHIRDNNMKVNR